MLKVLDYFKGWKMQVYAGSQSKPGQDLPPMTTLADLETTVKGLGALLRIGTECGAGMVPNRMTQDVVESWFGNQRQACGSNRNMTGSTAKHL